MRALRAVTRIKIFLKRKGARLIASLALIFVLCAGIALAFSPKISPPSPPTKTKNGVGVLSYAPADTAMALERALNAHDFRAELLYYKLALTADGKLVALSGKLKDAGNAAEYFGDRRPMPSEYTYARLRGINMGENFFDGGYPYRGLRETAIPENLKILSATEMFEMCRPFEKLLFLLELTDDSERAAERLAGLIIQYGLTDRAYVAAPPRAASFLDGSRKEIKRTATPAEAASLYFRYLFGRQAGSLPYDALMLTSDFYPTISRGNIIRYAQSLGIAVYVFSKDTKEELRKQLTRAPDAVISSVPALTFSEMRGG